VAPAKEPEKSSVYKLTNQCEEAFKTMKKAMMSPSILGYPDLFWIQMPVIRLLGQYFFKNGMDKKM
jgi:hypothetical protein